VIAPWTNGADSGSWSSGVLVGRAMDGAEQDELMEDLRDPARSAGALGTLARRDHALPRDVVAIVVALAHAPEWLVRQRAFECLAVHGDATHAELAVAHLADPEETVVVSALECLVAWRDGSAIDAIAASLDSGTELVRCYAAWALGRLDARRHRAQLEQLFHATPPTVVNSAAAEALYSFDAQPKYQTFLLQQLKHGDPEVRAFTSNSLVGIADDESTGVLVAALSAAAAREGSPAIREVMLRDLEILEET
jgi:HEAT repeat protein